MKAIILAAGRGSRMEKHTEGQPKCRTILHGKSLIEWQIAALKSGGVSDIAIVRGYLAGTFDFDVQYFDNDRWFSSNMVVSLLRADTWLSQNVCLVSYSDIIYSTKIVKALLAVDATDLSVAYDVNWRSLWNLRFGRAEEDAENFRVVNGFVEEIGKPIRDINRVNGQYMGLLRFTPQVWSKIKSFLNQLSDAEINRLDITTLLDKLLETGLKIKGVENNLPWYEVDTPSDLNAYHDMPRVVLT